MFVIRAHELRTATMGLSGRVIEDLDDVGDPESVGGVVVVGGETRSIQRT